MMNPILTMGQALSAQARLQPNRIGASDLDRQLTFAKWNERACRLANALLGIGLRPGNRVAVLAYNRIEWAEIYAAAAKSGLIAVPINFRLVGPEIRFILQDCEVGAVIVDDALIGSIEAIDGDLGLPEDRFIHLGGERTPAGWRSYEGLIQGAASDEPAASVSSDHPWCLMYTSGTTGNPKGAIRGHRGMAMLGLMTQTELGLRRQDAALLVMPMCHANSLNFFTAFLSGGAPVSIYSRPSFDPELCLRALGRSNATFTLVPTHYEMMLASHAGKPDNDGFGRVEKLVISSAPARADTKRAVMEMFPKSALFELYGSTEAGWVTMLHPDEQFERLGTVGREVVGSAPIRLLDDDGSEVADGTPGELYSCGPYAFDGYWRLPDKTAEAFRGEYLTVGDIAVREDGYIRLLDRKKNMIITGGENVYPTEVEAVLVTHPAVRDAVVIGLPDAKWGERVHAVIVPRDGASLSETELLDWIRNRLAGYKRPRSCSFAGEADIPRNATGKVLHRVLKDRLAAPAAVRTSV